MESGLVPREGDAIFLGVKASATWLDVCCVEINVMFEIGVILFGGTHSL